jgi:hypothetical protein
MASSQSLRFQRHVPQHGDAFVAGHSLPELEVGATLVVAGAQDSARPFATSIGSGHSSHARAVALACGFLW